MLGQTTDRDLLTMEEAREIIGKDARDGQLDIMLQALISGLSQACENFIGHPILFGTYTYDGTERPLVDGSGVAELVLPMFPVKTIDLFRISTSSIDFVEGDIWTAGAEYVLDRDSGIVTFHNASTEDLKNAYQLTIQAGFERGLTDSAEAARRGWPEGNMSLWLSVGRQLRHLWRAMVQNREGVQSVSADGVTTAFIVSRLLPDVLAEWRSQRDWRG